MKKHKIIFPSLLNYNYREENKCYRIVFAESKNYKNGYNSGSLYIRTPLTIIELKDFIIKRLNPNYPGVFKIEEKEEEEIEYMIVLSLQKLSWYIKNIIVK